VSEQFGVRGRTRASEEGSTWPTDLANYMGANSRNARRRPLVVQGVGRGGKGKDLRRASRNSTKEDTELS